MKSTITIMKRLVLLLPYIWFRLFVLSINSKLSYRMYYGKTVDH